MRGEYKREQLEDIVTNQLGEGIRKLLSKIVKKASKLSTFYLSKTQVMFFVIGSLGILPKVRAVGSSGTNHLGVESEIRGINT